MAETGRRLRATAALAAILVLATASGCGGDDDDSPPPTQVSTASGTVVGSEDTATGTRSWKGIPYARPPVGASRWRAPADPDPWTTPRSATAFGNACVQYGRIYGPGANNAYDATIGTTLNQAVGSEDCLYLNVWRPATGATGLPVIVFVHGGSNVSGYTADPMYQGAALARTADAVVVSVNYRLGIFGFLNLAQLKTGADPASDSGNFALLDVVKSLQWVNRNIAAFGGDPGNVTLMGQSAGAINVWALMTMPQVVNANPRLFHRAMPMSGGLSLATNLPPGSLPTLSPASTYQAQGSALLLNQIVADGRAPDLAGAQAYAASQTPQALADYLRSKDPAALLGTLLGRMPTAAGSGPIPDGTVLPADPIAAIDAGNYLKVPVLASNTRDEAKLFPTFLPLLSTPGNPVPSGRLVTDAQLFSNHFAYDPNAAPQTSIGQWIPAALLPANTPVTGFTARTDQLNRIFFIPSRDNVLDALKRQQPGVWYYQFDWDEEPAPWNDIYGAAHAFDLPFVFGNFGPSLFSNVAFSNANRPGRLELSDAMMRSVGAFARNGDPNDPALGVAWPTWPQMLVFDASPTVKAISVRPAR